MKETEYKEKIIKLSDENKITDEEFWVLIGLNIAKEDETEIRIIAKMLDNTILRLKQQKKYSEAFKEEYKQFSKILDLTEIGITI